MPTNLENSTVATGLKKVSFHSNPKECSNCRTIVLISYGSKGMLKILQARLQQNVNLELPNVQAGFIIGRVTRDQIANSHWIIEKAKEFEKNIYFCRCKKLTMQKPLTVWIPTNCGKFLDMGILDHLTCLLRNLYTH